MPEKMSDPQFKAEMLEFKTEMMRFVDTATKKFDGLTSDVRTNSFKLDKLDAEIGILKAQSAGHDGRFDILDERFVIQGEQLRIIDGRIADVASKVIEIEKRLTVVEAKLSLMETKLTSLQDEARQIRLEMNELNETAGKAVEFREVIDRLEVRVFQLEDKLSA